MVLKYLLQKEWLQIRRNSFLPRLILTYPIMLMCVMPWVMNMEVKNIAVAVVDNDHSARSQQLVHTIAANRYFRFKGEAPSYDVALRNVEQSRVDGVVVIPQGFAKDLQQGHTPHVLVAANAVNGTKGAIGSLYLSQIIVQTVVPEGQAIREQFHNYILYNRSQNFKLFMIPALFGIVMMLMTGYLPTLQGQRVYCHEATGPLRHVLGWCVHFPLWRQTLCSQLPHSCGGQRLLSLGPHLGGAAPS